MKNWKHGTFAVLIATLVMPALITTCEQLTNSLTLTGITAAYNGTTVYQNTQLNNLKANLTVMAQYSDNTSKTLTSEDYSLNGTLAVGISTIIVSYQGKTATFNVTVTKPQLFGTVSVTPNTDVIINTELTAAYTGSEPVSYQWNKDGTAISGATSNKYTPTEAGSYTVTVSATGYNPKTSVAVDVNDPSLGILSGSITISPNSDVSTETELTATYTGSETVNYQWKKDGDNVGTNSTKYTPTIAGSYTVTVNAPGYNSKTSAAVNVNALSLPTLSGSITISPNSDVFIDTELTATYTGSEPVSYQWNKDGTAISGATSNKYTPTEAGSYTVTVSATGCNPKTSAAITVLGIQSQFSVPRLAAPSDADGMFVTNVSANSITIVVESYTPTDKDYNLELYRKVDDGSGDESTFINVIGSSHIAKFPVGTTMWYFNDIVPDISSEYWYKLVVDGHTNGITLTKLRPYGYGADLSGYSVIQSNRSGVSEAIATAPLPNFSVPQLPAYSVLFATGQATVYNNGNTPTYNGPNIEGLTLSIQCKVTNAAGDYLTLSANVTIHKIAYVVVATGSANTYYYYYIPLPLNAENDPGTGNVVIDVIDYAGGTPITGWLTF